jgi:hypothetical protein
MNVACAEKAVAYRSVELRLDSNHVVKKIL